MVNQRVLVVGSGGREHALAWKLAQSPLVKQVYVAPGNAGTYYEAGLENIDIAADDIAALLDFAQQQHIDLTVIGPEAPLACGIVDQFQAANLACFGPTQAAAQLESSKAYSKAFMQRHQIPSAAYAVFTNIDEALAYIQQQPYPLVIKADGLAAGKGVIIAENQAQAEAAAKDMLNANLFGEAGHRILVETFLQGEEASFICMVDGEHVLALASSQDHKAREEGDKGANTGGMGAYSPAPVVTDAIHQRILEQIIYPTVKGMAAEGNPYTGFLYAGLMINQQGDCQVLEYNCRFGDPETQPIMMRLQSDLFSLCIASLEKNLDKIEAQWDQRVALGVVLAADGYPASYRKGDVINFPAEQQADEKIFHAGTQIQADHCVTQGGRVLCACSLGKDVAQAQQKAYDLVAKISWQGMVYRTDIGYRGINRQG